MTIDVQSNCDTAMPQHRLYGLWRLSQLQHQRGKGVPGIMESDRGQPCLRYQPLEGLDKHFRGHRGAIGPAEDKAMVLIRWSQTELFFRLPRFMLVQRCQAFLRDRHSTAGVLRLGLLNQEPRSPFTCGSMMVLHPHKRLPDLQGACLEINILPAER